MPFMRRAKRPYRKPTVSRLRRETLHQVPVYPLCVGCGKRGAHPKHYELHSTPKGMTPEPPERVTGGLCEECIAARQADQESGGHADGG